MISVDFSSDVHALQFYESFQISFLMLSDISTDILSVVQVTENKLDLQGGVWSLDGTKEVQHTMSTLLAKPDSSSDPSEQPKKAAKLSTTYCGVTSLQGLDHHMSQAHKLGLSLARYIIGKGGDQILRTAKEQNNALMPSNNPNPIGNKDVESVGS